MSDFSYTQGINYFPPFPEIFFGPGIVTDDDNDDQFESGDTDDLGWIYAGTTVVDGIVMPVFTGTGAAVGGGGVQIYNPSATPVTWPATAPTITPGAYVFCFAPGTAIAVPGGTRTVEDLNIGDLVTTADGRSVPVRWIGRQTVFHVFARDRALPVRIAAGALGPGVPLRDLVLTAEHGLVLDGVVVNAGALVNGTTIRFVPRSALPEVVTYYHVETATHDVLLAEGTPAESFIDYAARRCFDNYAEYLAQHGAERALCEMPLPRVSSQRHLPPGLRARLGLAVEAGTDLDAA